MMLIFTANFTSSPITSVFKGVTAVMMIEG